MGDDVQNPTPTTPPATGTPISDTSTIGPDFSQVPGHMEHKSAAAAAHDRSTFTSLTGDINNATAPIENYTPEGRKEHPILSKIGDVTRGVKELLEGGQEVGKGMGTSSGVANNPVAQAVMTAPDAAAAGAKAEDYVAENAPKVAEHIAETGRNFVRGAKAGVEHAAAATAPEGSLEAGFAKIPGHQVERPNPQITSEGPAWERVHTATVDGKTAGKVGVKTDPNGRAQIYGSVVPKDMRGQGIGQKLYKQAIEDARANGATHITSDSTNTSADANRVWHKLTEKNEYPVEEITHPNGKAGYQIKFDPAGAQGAEESVPVADMHANLLKVPDERLPERTDTQSVINHEAGHAVVGHTLGLDPIEIRSHLHDENIHDGSAASTHFSYRNVGGNEAGEIPASKLKQVFEDKLIPTLMGGGVAQESLHGLSMTANGGMSGDIEQAFELGKQLGYSPAEMNRIIENGKMQARSILTHQPTLDTIGKYTAEREEGLPDRLHMSYGKMQDMLAEIKKVREVHGQSEDTTGRQLEDIREGRLRVPAPDDAGRTGGSPSSEAGTAQPKFKVTEDGPYHPNLQKVADKYGVTDDPYKISHGASFITPDGKYIHLGGGIDHNRAIENVTGVMDGSKDNRPDFLNPTGAIRTRMTFGREGHTLHVSVPEKGITAEQVDALKAAAHQGLGGGKNGNIVMETATGGKSAEEQFANANNIEPMLKKIGVHPDGAEPQEWHQRAEEESKKNGGSFTIDPRTGAEPNSGHILEAVPEARQVSDKPNTAGRDWSKVLQESDAAAKKRKENKKVRPLI